MNAKSFASFTQILNYLIKYFKIVVFAAIALGVLSGIYQVESNEVAVVLRFGRLVGDIPSQQIQQPGIHFSFPFFIDEVIKVPVQTVHQKEILTHYTTGGDITGSTAATEVAPSPTAPTAEDILRGISVAVDEGQDASGAAAAAPEALAPSLPSNGYLLTGDNNVVLMRTMVKYKIGNAAQYVLYSCDAGSAIDGIVSGELTHLVTHMDINSVLTSGKAQLASEILNSSQKILDNLQTGIIITDLEFTEITPPAGVKTAFEEVVTASVNKETAIQEATRQASTLILEAEATAKNYKQDAIYAQTIRLTRARNETAEFNGMFDKYTDDPQIIINGTFRQRVSAVLKKMGGSIIVPDGNSAPTIILP